MVERQTARICRINHLAAGNYVEQEGWNPNYVETEVGEVSRVNLMAVVVSSDAGILVVDDGSGKMEVRSFNGTLDFNVGDRVLIVGRPRVFNDNMYIASEIVRKLPDDRWLEFRRLQIEMIPRVTVQKVERREEMQPEPQQQEENQAVEKILEKIRKFDSGDGADIDEVIKGIASGDKMVSSLLEQGEIYEVRPGRIKVLE